MANREQRFNKELALSPFIRLVHKHDNLAWIDHLLTTKGGVLQANPKLDRMIIAPRLLNGYVSLM